MVGRGMCVGWLCCVLLLLVVSGCEAEPQPPPPVSGKLEQVSEGMSISDVKGLLGDPEGEWAADGEKILQYRREMRVFELRFEDDQLVTKEEKDI